MATVHGKVPASAAFIVPTFQLSSQIWGLSLTLAAAIRIFSYIQSVLGICSD